VAEELRVRGADDVTVSQLTSCPWLAIRKTGEISPTIMQWGLGPGESAVLAEALGRRAVVR